MRYQLIAVLSVTSLLAFCVPTRAAELLVSAQSVREEVVLGEPIYVRLLFENRGQTELTLDLGTSDVAKLLVTWEREGSSGTAMKREGKGAHGFAADHSIQLKPGTSFEHLFLLDKLLVPNQAGTYDLSVEISGQELPAAYCKVHVTAAPPASTLTTEIKDWFQQAKGTKVPEEERAAVERLVYTRAIDAIPYQLDLVIQRKVDPKERAIVLNYIVSVASKDEALMRQLVGLLETSATDSEVRSSILFAIKSFGWENLIEATKKICEGYKAEIEKSAPTVVSD